MSSREPNKGQSKMHTITNTSTGESRQITQEEWRTQGQQLRAEGWTRPEDEGTEGAEGTEGTEQ